MDRETSARLEGTVPPGPDDQGQRQPTHILRLWFEWGADTAFWPANDVAREHFGIGHFDVDKLPLTEQTRTEVREMAAWHDKALNWEYPPDPGPWREDECARFNSAVRALYDKSAHELGVDYQLIFAAREVHEDSDLDAYLRDPKGFRRAAGPS